MTSTRWGADKAFGMRQREITRGHYRVRVSRAQGDVRAAQALRYRAFFDADGDGLDADAHDGVCDHVLIEDIATGRLVACFRLLALTDGSQITRSYSARFYDLSSLSTYRGAMVEMGRFCVAPGERNADVLRIAWGAVAAYVDQRHAEMLFGCSSFSGTDGAAYRDAFAMLRAHHLGPRRWLPRIKAPNVFRFAGNLQRAPDAQRALLTMPPLLRSYLLMGGWVSDHAVVDDELNTMHVFTGLEVAKVPAARARSLRAVAG